MGLNEQWRVVWNYSVVFLMRCNLFVLLLVVQIHCSAQSDTLDLRSQEYAHYDLSDGFSTQCFEKVFQDPSGLLWLKTCPFVGGQYNHHFTTFDGYTPKLPNLTGEKIPSGSIVRALGMSDDGIIYGVYANESLEENGLFLLHTAEMAIDVFNSATLKSSLPLVTCRIEGNEIQMLMADSTGFDLYTFDLESENSELIASKRFNAVEKSERVQNLANPYSGRFIGASHLIHNLGNYWILGGGPPLFEYNGKNDSFTKIDLNEIYEEYHPSDKDSYHYPYLVARSEGDFLFIPPTEKNEVLRYVSDSGIFSDFNGLRPAKEFKSASTGKSANLEELVVFRYRSSISKERKFLLLEEDNKVSELIADERINYIYHTTRSSLSDDLFLATDAGLFVYRSISNKPAQSFLPSLPTRGLLPVDTNKIIVSMGSKDKSIGIFDLNSRVLDNAYFSSDYEGRSSAKFVQRKDGKVWFPDYAKIGLIDVESREIEEFANPYRELKRFDILNDSILLVLSDGGLYAWNPKTERQELLYFDEEVKNKTGHLNEMLLDVDGDIYCATNSGLLKIQRDFSQHTFYGENWNYQELKILCLTQDSQGRLWMGTYGNGVYVFDPQTEDYRQISIREGLLSNTVVSLERDQLGHFWAGTFNGVSQIEIKTLAVRNTLLEKDGLANNESNRFSSGTFDDGRIMVGSIEGFSIIDPYSSTLDEFQEKRSKLLISSINWKDSNTGVIQNAANYNGETITLSAKSPNLTIDLAVSNYLNPSLHSFKYKIGNGTWTLAEFNRSLFLSELENGDYPIEIKGIDDLGRETINSITVPVSVLPFFYEEWWFLTLCSVPFFLLILAAVRRRQRSKELKQIEAETSQLHKLNEFKSRFFSNISHEFRTPLTLILGPIQAKLSGTTDPKEREELRLMERNAKRLQNMINDILDLAKSEAGQLEFQKESINVSETILGVAEAFSSKSDLASIDYKINVPRDIRGRADKGKFETILVNLISNAFKYTNEGGTISVDATIKDDMLTVSISDTGRGIGKEDLSRIFDRFYQIENKDHGYIEGTGIGLAFTKELVELCGGNITVESELNKGSVFSFTMPYFPEMYFREEKKEQIESEIKEVLSNPKKVDNKLESDAPLILLVEDNEDVRTYMNSILSDTYQLIFGTNGEEGLENALHTIPDIIVSDVMMPKMDGFELCEAIKTNPLTSHIPLILLTAKSSSESRIKGLEHEADIYMSKPFNPKELELQVRNLLKLKERLREKFRADANKIIPDPIKQNSVEAKFLNRLDEVMKANFEDPEFTVEKMGKEMGMSRTQLHRKLKALTGDSTTKFIRIYRLKIAHRRIASDDASISEIAYQVGFNSVPYFNKCFKQEFGAPPGELKES